ncbi:hypothetical protein F511_47357 [Dorcoceras hygrometricum]|uniref:Uncharacterized protein n=1 Tax=Dorcoceras hygrometricum TaxID=472368 RepID=A0A2Z6ZXK2_9LAMI|nr:hypothetical protein F511_47357 [Dorcoceras hygrometricum]
MRRPARPASCATLAHRAAPLPATMRGQRAWLSRAHARAAGWNVRRRKRRWRGQNFDSDFVLILKNKMLDTIMAYRMIRSGKHWL